MLSRYIFGKDSFFDKLGSVSIVSYELILGLILNRGLFEFECIVVLNDTLEVVFIFIGDDGIFIIGSYFGFILLKSLLENRDSLLTTLLYTSGPLYIVLAKFSKEINIHDTLSSA
jgi:hypothetical protein